ncbi:G5 domain-containing protein [Aerococcaceae bacterium NML210727]|nr:G5 domain-containing protein [Aerococcaceae bacterium NML210727]MCW6653921.1 G5 domain-containing protein [Aerococcaceae bacterium NML201296]
MKKLRKVKKHWIAVGFGLAVLLPMGATSVVSAEETSELTESKQATTASETGPDDGVSSSQVTPMTNEVASSVNSDGTTSSLNPDDVPGYDLSHIESLISDDNLSQKVKDSRTPDSRTLVSKPVINGVNYNVHYDQENQWYYVKVSEFANEQKTANQQAVQSALQAANQIVMRDGEGNLHTGIAVKVDTNVHLHRDQGELSHYEVMTFDGGVPFNIKGTVNGVANPARVTEEEYAAMSFSSEGLISYKDNSGIFRQGIVMPIYNKPAKFEQIVIDQSLSNVRALYSDRRNPSRITTNLSQFGAMWDSNENNTDARDHAVILIDNVDGLLVNNILIDILRPQLAAGQVNDEFYKRGLPYYGKVSGMIVNDSNNIRLDTVNAVGANRAGISFTSTYNQSFNHTVGGRKTSLEKLVQAGQRSLDELKLGRNNQVINSQLHHNRVAGLMFAYQENFIAENNLVYDNGHPLSGSTGYGIASSAGSYNNHIHYRKNTSYRNYRKGLDIHDADNIVIVGNLSIGDRLNGISVYNRSYKMEHVKIENNLVLQIPEHRLAKDDLTDHGQIRSGSDYANYTAILIQTNEKNRDLSAPGSKGKFSISNNTIQGLAKDGLEGTGNIYITEAIILRMNEPYLDYDLDVSKNVIQGESANAIVKMINSSYDSRNNNRLLPDFSKYKTALGLGSGNIRFTGNDIQVGSIYGNPQAGVAPFTFTESTLNTLVVETKRDANGKTTTAHRHTGTVQDKFRGSFTFADNKIKFDNTIMSTNGASESVVNILTNTEGIVFKNNQLSLGKVTGLGMTTALNQAPLIRVSGLTSPTINSTFTHNAERGISNLPNSLRRTQPLIMLNNDISMSSLTYGNDQLRAAILVTNGVVRYMAHNDVSSDSAMRIGIASPDKADPTLGNVLYTNDTRIDQPQSDRDNRDFNLPRVRIGHISTETVTTDVKRYTAPIQYIFSEDLLVGQYEVIQAGKDGEISRKISTLKVENGKRDTNSYDILRSILPSHFNIANVKDATDNPAIPGLLRADYTVVNGDVFAAIKDYPYGTTAVNGTPTTTRVEYRYENLPIGLKEATALNVEEDTVTTESLPRIIVVGRGIPVYETDRISEPIPYLKRYVADTKGLAGERSVGQPGVEGERIKVYRVLRNANTGQIKDSYLIESVLVRNPLEEIVIVGTLEYVDETVPFEEETIRTDTLFDGETKRVEGEFGTRRTNYLYELDTETGLLGNKALDNVVMIKPVRNAITYIGTKPRLIEQEEIEVREIPFETFTKYSNQLPEGQTVVEQEGIVGELTIRYKVVINNQDGNQISREVLSETVTKPSQTRIIVIGSKTIEQKSRIAFETVATKVVYRQSDALAKGSQLVAQEGKDGLHKVTYMDTVRLSDGKVIETQETERQILVSMEERIILVGIMEPKPELKPISKNRIVEEVIPYKRTEKRTQELESGKETVLIPGQNGVLRYTYLDRFDHNGNLISSELLSEEIVQEAVSEEVLVGEASNPNKPMTSVQTAMLPATGEASEAWQLVGVLTLGVGGFLKGKRKGVARKI